MFQWNRHFHERSLRLLAMTLLSIPAVAQTPAIAAPATPAKDAFAQTSAASATDTTVKLSPGDLIELSVYGVPDLSTKARIGNSGDVYLPLIDYTHLEGLTVEEAQSLVEKRYQDGGFVQQPHVAILVDESASQAINIMGEVNRPGAYPAVGNRHLFDMISAAGGLTEKAGRNVTVIHRQNPEQRVELHLASNLGEDTQNNVEIVPGDTIIVARAGVIYVVGDVARPSGFMIEDNTLTVLKALALAGGGTRTSSLNNSKILRQTPSGVQQIPVHLKKVLQARADDLPMQKGDVLFVPGSAAKSVAYRSAETAMSLTTALAVIAVHP